MKGYAVIPQVAPYSSAEQIVNSGLLLYTSTEPNSYRRVAGSSTIGETFLFNNVYYLNQHYFKVNYFEDSQYIWLVITTVVNTGTELHPAPYWADSGFDNVTLFTTFSNVPMYYDKITMGRIALSKQVKLPSWASVYSSLQECIDAVNDDKWGQDDFDSEPYSEIPSTNIGGNIGSYDFTSSDIIDFPVLPEVSANTAGFVSLWSPTNNQLLTLAGYLWNKDLLTSEFWKKLIANPIELVFGLSIVPIDLTDYIDGTYSVVVGWIDTKILMRHLNTQWITVDCGEIDLEETWGSYLDYDPFTKLEIYLPFCGIHPLKIDDFMPGKISLSYNIDLMTGSCVAMVKSTKASDHGDVLDSVVYQFMGNCATQIPITAQQFADAVRSAISIAASIGSMVATGVGGAAASAGALMGGSAETADKRAAHSTAIKAHTATSLINTGASAAENVMNIKPSIERSGAIGFSGSLLGVRTPYIILTRPRMARPDSQNSYTGYPSFMTEELGDLSGLTIVQAIHLEGIPATADEINEIESLLKGGVFF